MATSSEPRRRPLTEGDILSQIAAADRLPAADEPTARSITFDPAGRRYELHLTNGTSVGFSADSLWELRGASVEALAAVELVPSGSSLTWPMLDMDVSVAGLVLDLLGSPQWRRALRRSVNAELARIRTEATARAARENGKKGGRPPKSAGR